MKKVIAVLAVAAMVGVSSFAFAASDIAVGGQIDIRSRNFNNLKLYDADQRAVAGTDGSQNDTQERVRLDVNIKNEGVTGKISIENDWDSFGRNENYMANGGTTNTQFTDGSRSAPASVGLMLKEAWVGFKLPDTPVGVKAGHMLLSLGNKYFFRSMNYGSDAWVVYTDIDKLHLGFVNVKVSEGAGSTGSYKNNDDVDAYVLVATYKIDDKSNGGVNLTQINGRSVNNVKLTNFEAHFDGVVGPVNLKAQLDMQSGKLDNSVDGGSGSGADDVKFSGNQIILEGKMAMGDFAVNAAFARGSGDKSGPDADPAKHTGMVNFLDITPTYTFLYEYKVVTAAGARNTGFANTTALNLGGSGKIGKSLTLGANLWFLTSTEKVSDKSVGATDQTNDLGTEFDVTANWQITPSLNWKWDLGYLKAGKGLGRDNALGAMGVLSFKF